MDRDIRIQDMTEGLMSADSTSETSSPPASIPLRFPVVPPPSPELPEKLEEYLDLNTRLPSDKEFNRIMAKNRGRSTASSGPDLLPDVSLDQVVLYLALVFVVCLLAWWLHSFTAALAVVLASGCIILAHRLNLDRKRCSRYPVTKQSLRPVDLSWVDSV